MYSSVGGGSNSAELLDVCDDDAMAARGGAQVSGVRCLLRREREEEKKEGQLRVCSDATAGAQCGSGAAVASAAGRIAVNEGNGRMHRTRDAEARCSIGAVRKRRSECGGGGESERAAGRNECALQPELRSTQTACDSRQRAQLRVGRASAQLVGN